MDKNNKVFALGCRLNIFEAELIKEQAEKANIKNTIFVNSCTVTQEAHKQSQQLVRKLKRENPNSKIVVTGCAAQVDEDSFLHMPEVDKVIGNNDKFSVNAFLSQEKLVKTNMNDALKDFSLPQIQHFENKTRAFIQIQQGCDHRCTFCIIYQARGKSKSLSKENIIEQIKKVVRNGHKDVVLTGVDISSWNRDALTNEPSQIGELCKNILQEVPELPRLRLSSLDPAVEDKHILDLLKNEPKFMPHIHLSLQSLNNNVLKNMGRRHSKESSIQWINNIRNAHKNVALGADFICGFPRETDEQFEETYQSVKELKIPFLHVFPYSVRSGTTAEKMKSIPFEIRKRRAKMLQELGITNKISFFEKKLHSNEEILCEANNLGYTKDYCPIKIINTSVDKKEIVNVKITDYNAKHLIGEITI